MCKPASFVLVKKETFFSARGDSHEQIIREHSLAADGSRGPNIVRVEIVPPGGNYKLPVAGWVYWVDQDILPEWYDAEDCERRARAALPRWAETHIFTEGSVTCEEGQTVIAFGNAKIEQPGGLCFAHDNAKIAQSGGDCYAYGNAKIAQSGGYCSAFDNSKVTQSGGYCNAYDNAKIAQSGGQCSAHGNAKITKSGGQCSAHGNAKITKF